MDISQQIENDNYSLLNKNTIKELHQLCRENGIKNYSKLRKSELVELLDKLQPITKGKDKIMKFMERVSTRYNIPIEELRNLYYDEKEVETNPIILDDRISCRSSPVKKKNVFIEIIEEQKQKEENGDIWKNSQYKDIVKLQSNNVGIVGEKFIQKLCDECNINSKINGTRMRTRGGGVGDGLINNNSIEIKTAIKGSNSSSFQHELGEKPWISDFMLFIDISPNSLYITIFKNFTEEYYKSGKKCVPYFPTKIVTWRKKIGAFKLDTSIKINEENILRGFTLKITDEIDLEKIKRFILQNIN